MLRFGVLCALLALVLFISDQFGPVDQVLNDWRTRFVLQSQAESRIVVIDVDERSLAARSAVDGAWPWPRATIARLLKILIDDYGVTSIAVDMVFPEPRADDELLREQFRRSQVTGAIYYDLDGRTLPDLKRALPSSPPLDAAANAKLVNGRPAVSNHADVQPGRAGHITPIFDSDGVLRRLPPVICIDGRSCRPSLTLAAFTSLFEQPRLRVEPGQGWLAPSWTLSVGSADGGQFALLPLTRDGMLLVPYRHAKKDWIYISAADILEHKVDPALLKGVLAVLGGTALGLSDVIATPVSPVTAGLEPHVEILSALLDNDFPVEPRWGLLLDGLVLLPFVILLVLSVGYIGTPAGRAAWFPAWLLLTWSCSALMMLAALRQLHLLLPLVPLLLFPPLALLATLVMENYRSRSEHAGVLSLLSAYLPASVASRLAGFTGRGAWVSTTMDATRREITVLFADVRGFAGITENQSPELVARLMQRFFAEMAEAAVMHHGTIDKFIGDAIMVIWNAPEDDPAHARHALAAAFEIQRRVEALAPFCIELGFAPINVGIGMETGSALVGNFGSIHRRTFTALGEPVVLASRLEGMTTKYNEKILTGPGCAAALGLSAMRALGEVQVRGRGQALALYAPDKNKWKNGFVTVDTKTV